ncbi:hypothetical protein WJX72_003846 [[Myrmecia] bisecta]|uniref:Uncharacterized protein n=1 Tax=[Myrmecia] bisecta TaxID=41462 RepID=A0AAW1QR09_9CHLO
MDFLARAREGDVLAVQKILQVNPSCVDAKDAKTSQTALHIAAQIGNLDIVKELLAKGVGYDAQDKQGNVALHTAVQHGHIEVVRELLGRGYRLASRIKNKDGHTPLHVAAKAGNAEAVQALVAAGARPEVKDKEGKTPMDLAAGNAEVLAALSVAASASVTVTAVRASIKEPLSSASSLDSTSSIPRPPSRSASGNAQLYSGGSKAAARTGSRTKGDASAGERPSSVNTRKPERSPSMRSTDTLGPTKKLELLDTKVQTQEEKIREMESKMAELADTLEAERAAMAEERTALLASTSAGNAQRQKHFEEQEQRVTLHENNMKEMRLLVDQLKERMQQAVENGSLTPPMRKDPRSSGDDPPRLAEYQAQVVALRGQMGQLEQVVASIRLSTPPPPVRTPSHAELDALRSQIGQLEQAVATIKSTPDAGATPVASPTPAATPASTLRNNSALSPGATSEAEATTPGAAGSAAAARTPAAADSGRQVSPVAINLPASLATKFSSPSLASEPGLSPSPSAARAAADGGAGGGAARRAADAARGLDPTHSRYRLEERERSGLLSPQLTTSPDVVQLIPQMQTQMLSLDTRLRALERADSASHHFARTVGSEMGAQRRKSTELDEHRHLTELRLYKMEEDLKFVVDQCQGGGVAVRQRHSDGASNQDVRRSEQDMELRAREAKILELREMALKEEEARRAGADALAAVRTSTDDQEKRIYALEHTLDKLLQRLPFQIADDSDTDAIDIQMSQTERINKRLHNLEEQVAAARAQQRSCGACVVC